MNSIKTLRLNFFVFLGGFVIQLALIWWLYPSPADFTPIKVITGTYTYQRGSARIGPYTEVGGHPVFCNISFLGPKDACYHKYLHGQTVTVQIARYRHLFGEGEVVVQATLNGQVQINYSREQLVDMWRSDSIINAIFYTFISVIIFSGVRTYLSICNSPEFAEEAT